MSLLIKNIADTEKARIIKDLYVFKIFVVLNPDGVVIGNSRVGIEGVDLNRVWNKPDPQMHPIIFQTCQAIKSIREKRKILMFCDLHSHSTKCNSFMYGCPPTINSFSSWSQTHLIPRMLAKLAPTFSYKDSTYIIDQTKVSSILPFNSQ